MRSCKKRVITLPSPDKLVPKEQSVKITLQLSQSAIDYFKSVAKKYEVCYQVMIRNLLDEYVKQYQDT